MSKIILYMAPGTCARVPCILLEEAGAEFETKVIRFMKGEHKSPAYKVINPLGKVPALSIDDVVLTENPAIITYLNERYPDAKLLPFASSARNKVKLLADLCFCASTLHPIVTRIRLPHFFAGKEAAQKVWELACTAMDEYFQVVEDQLKTGPWWYGEKYSAMDAYLYWIFWRVEGGGYKVERFPRFCSHRNLMEARPAVVRALKREALAEAELAKEGLVFTPPPLS